MKQVYSPADDAVQELRNEEIREPKVRLPITSKNHGNHNGAKTKPGVVIYDISQKARKVVIRGTVFDWAEKGVFGFIASDHSILGALETTQDEAQVKCHECGAWRARIGSHVRAHKLSPDLYREKHGLMRTTSLTAPAQVRHFSKIMKDRRGVMNLRSVAPRASGKISDMPYGKAVTEAQNLTFGCMAQLTVRLTNLTAKLGHVPTQKELRQGDEVGPIHQSTIKWAFGMTVADALRSIGLRPRRRGGQSLPERLQLQILQMRAAGATYPEIQAKLRVSPNSISRYGVAHA